jgi:hypothetical protein
MSMPSLVAGARAYGIKTSVTQKHPDSFKMLETTLKKAIADPAFKKAYLKTKNPWELVGYHNSEEAAAYAKGVTEIGREFKNLLSGK